MSAAAERRTECSDDHKVRRIKPLIDSLFAMVLYDEEPLFISDEATLLDVSLALPEELIRRCSRHYRTAVSMEDLKTPLLMLLPELERKRTA